MLDSTRVGSSGQCSALLAEPTHAPQCPHVFSHSCLPHCCHCRCAHHSHSLQRYCHDREEYSQMYWPGLCGPIVGLSIVLDFFSSVCPTGSVVVAACPG